MDFATFTKVSERERETDQLELNKSAIHCVAGASATSSHVDEEGAAWLLHLCWPPIRPA